MTFVRHFWRPITAVVLGALISGSALAQSVTTRLVVGGGAATSTKVVPGGSVSMDVRLDILTASIFGTGFTISQTAPGSSGFFSITGRSFAGSPFDDATSGTPDATVLAAASALLDPANNDNLGRTTIGFAGIPPAANVLAVNLTLTASAATPVGTYTILPTPGLSFATDTSFNDYSMSAGTPFTIIVGHTLTVTKSGTGTGTVTANSGAINCGATCSDIYPGTAVTLTPTPAAGSVFAGWSGACSGTGTCVVTMNSAQSVGAVFNLQTFALTTTKSGTGTGTLTSTPAGINCGATCTFSFNSGTAVTLTPTPAAGSVFAGWSGACSGTGTCVVTMNSAQSVGAVFTLQTFALTTTKSGTGTGTLTSTPAGINCGATCTFSFNSGTAVTLTPTPAAGSVFAGWSGACSGTGTCVVTMNSAQSVGAVFTLQTFALTTTKSGTGTGTLTSTPAGINCGATCTFSFNSGTAVTLTPTPAAGSVFAGWSGACSGTGTCVVTMNSAQSVGAVFTLQTFALTTTKSGTGTGTLTSTPAGINCGATCTFSFNSGTAVTLTPTPAAGSVFAGWSGACSGTGTCVVTMNSAQSVGAVFTLQTFALTTTKSGTGTGTLTSTPAGINCGATCTFSFNSGTAVTLTPTPAAGSVFAGWSGACSGTGTCVVTMNSAQSVGAVFTLQTFALTTTKSGTGTGTLTSTPAGINCGATCTFSFNSGTAVTLTPTPAAGSVFAGWSGACSGTGTCVVTMNSAQSVGAVFTLQTFALTTTKSGTGTGTLTSTPAGINCGATCTFSFNSGTAVTLTPTPAAGSVFAGWSGACSGTGTCVVTMNSAQSVGAVFTLQTFALTTTKSGTGTGTLTSTPAGINCGATCTFSFNSGTAVTLTPTPAAGSVFAGWSGACSGTGTCVVTMNSAQSVGAVFTLQTFALTTTKSGTGTGTLTSTPAGINCGATCTFSFNSGTAVTLTPTPAAGSVFAGWSGACTGTGACVVTMSVARSVNAVFNPTAPVLGSVVSRRTHGAAGTFDLPLGNVATNPTTEPRQGPAFTLVFTFNKAVTAGVATVSAGTATAAAPTFAGNEMRVALSGVANQQYVTVTLSNVTASDGGTGGVGSIRVGFLLGDVNQNRVVTLTDLGLVNGQVAQFVTAANYTRDVNVSGTMSLADKGVVNAELTRALPAP